MSDTVPRRKSTMLESSRGKPIMGTKVTFKIPQQLCPRPVLQFSWKFCLSLNGASRGAVRKRKESLGIGAQSWKTSLPGKGGQWRDIPDTRAHPTGMPVIQRESLESESTPHAKTPRRKKEERRGQKDPEDRYLHRVLIVRLLVEKKSRKFTPVDGPVLLKRCLPLVCRQIRRQRRVEYYSRTFNT